MISVGEKQLTLDDISKIIYSGEKIELSTALLKRADDNFHFLKDFAANKVIYGINTGFGPMAQFKIAYSERLTLQYNLIRSHASGSGKPIDVIYAKAMLIDRLNTFAQCKSGVHPDLLILIKEMINQDLIPVIYEHGGVGASGDLVQLAHMGLAIIGEGEIWHEGKIYDATEILHKHKLTPFAIRLREGLGLMNGTSCMTGIGLVNLLAAKKLLNWSTLISITINEIFEAFDDHISAPLNQVKLHAGQNIVADAMRKIVSSSKLMRNRQEHLYTDTPDTHFKDKVQEYYSLRCMPQIIGPIYDTIAFAEKILVDELNSVSDNPVIDDEIKNVYHGGNFHGDYVALEMDKLKIAITKLSMLADRQLNYLLNDKLNGKLPAFINKGTVGLNFGIQGIQYTATSTVAENQTLSNPVYVHSIPSNNDNQDLVSMGSNAALMAARVIENTFEVLAVHSLAVAEAVDYLEKGNTLSVKPKEFYDGIRKCSSKIEGDVPKFKELKTIKEFLKTENPNVI
ncbi:MAG: aromatic amino acid ammonia-lyase [Bacteroidetes bacterium]|nr:aromatic amino acid ammonia-lyase [Bacteroidota bacterium]